MFLTRIQGQSRDKFKWLMYQMQRETCHINARNRINLELNGVLNRAHNVPSRPHDVTLRAVPARKASAEGTSTRAIVTGSSLTPLPLPCARRRTRPLLAPGPTPPLLCLPSSWDCASNTVASWASEFSDSAIPPVCEDSCRCCGVVVRAVLVPVRYEQEPNLLLPLLLPERLLVLEKKGAALALLRMNAETTRPVDGGGRPQVPRPGANRVGSIIYCGRGVISPLHVVCLVSEGDEGARLLGTQFDRGFYKREWPASKGKFDNAHFPLVFFSCFLLLTLTSTTIRTAVVVCEVDFQLRSSKAKEHNP